MTLVGDEPNLVTWVELQDGVDDTVEVVVLSDYDPHAESQRLQLLCYSLLSRSCSMFTMSG